jgi:outer membrane receptor protein involved in Fe transport
MDVKLDGYVVNHLTINYDYIPGYDIFFNVKNLFNETYNTALDYSQPNRSFGFGLRKSFD